jgi:hypothetical protein
MRDRQLAEFLLYLEGHLVRRPAPPFGPTLEQKPARQLDLPAMFVQQCDRRGACRKIVPAINGVTFMWPTPIGRDLETSARAPRRPLGADPYLRESALAFQKYAGSHELTRMMRSFLE